MNKYAIIVAGGTGSRMKGEVPKQFMHLCGKPVILYSIEAFFAYDTAVEIILVIHPEYFSLWEKLISEFKVPVPYHIVAGGKTRFDSVKNGLETIQGDGLVAVHDAARPLINIDFIRSLYEAASVYGSAIPAINLNDTIRVIEGDTSMQLDRSFLRAIQTPQVFRIPELQRAYTQLYLPVFTDDASVLQAAGFPVHLTEGIARNIKITHPQDIALAEVLMRL